jgi:hypothetical protein
MMAMLLLIGALIFSLVGCSTGATSTTQITPSATAPITATAQPTTQSVPAGTVLYKADWSQGAGNWKLGNGWKVVGKALQVDSLDDTNIIVPYQPTVLNYAIDLRFMPERVLQPGAAFNIIVHKSADRDGYTAGILAVKVLGPASVAGSAGQAQVYLEPANTVQGNASIMSNPIDYVLDPIMHDYRIEVRNGEISFLDNGVVVGHIESISDNVSDGPIVLDSSRLMLNITSLTVTAL